jgi:hypothetical protein
MLGPRGNPQARNLFGIIGYLTAVRFAELGSSKHRVKIRDFDSSLPGRI